MTHAYDKIYLSKARNTLASMLDFAVYDLREDITAFYKKFLLSKIASQFERGESAVVAGKSGVELALDILGDEALAKKYRPVANKSPEYWAGWALTYFQWENNLTFKQIDNFIPITEIVQLYTPYHEMDISQFCDKMLELYNANRRTSSAQNSASLPDTGGGS